MYTYDLLETGCYYLIREKEGAPISLIKISIETDHCFFIIKYDDANATGWYLKKDVLFDIIECLSDDKVKEWMVQYKGSHFPFMEEEDDDEK